LVLYVFIIYTPPYTRQSTVIFIRSVSARLVLIMALNSFANNQGIRKRLTESDITGGRGRSVEIVNTGYIYMSVDPHHQRGRAVVGGQVQQQKPGAFLFRSLDQMPPVRRSSSYVKRKIVGAVVVKTGAELKIYQTCLRDL
jgi:hypothetical protein